MDMAVLVDAQGEMLDNIESQVRWYTHKKSNNVSKLYVDLKLVHSLTHK